MAASLNAISVEQDEKPLIHLDDRRLRTLALELLLDSRPAHPGEKLLIALDRYLNAREERLLARVREMLQTERV